MRPEEITVQWAHDRCKPDGDCLIWSCHCDSKGAPRYRFRDVGLDSTLHLRSRVWAAAGKKKLRKGEVVTMECGNPGCLNPDHMQTITRAEVLARTMQSRTVRARQQQRTAQTNRKLRAKITMEQARYIRNSTKPLTVVAKECGISFQRASLIRRGEGWPELVGNPFAGLGA